jgi:8-oxo-dGTP pyrophosphatase MutT (NUDIX family)
MIYTTPPENYNPKVSIAACFIEHKDKVLFLHRAEHISQGGTWAIPAGKVHSGETVEDAVKREVLEETSIILKNPQFLKTVYIRYADYDFTYHMFRETLTTLPTVVLEPKESQDFKWLNRAEVNVLETQNKLILDEMPCILEVYADNEFGTFDKTAA